MYKNYRTLIEMGLTMRTNVALLFTTW
jgi:hypothetical protein